MQKNKTKQKLETLTLASTSSKVLCFRHESHNKKCQLVLGAERGGVTTLLVLPYFMFLQHCVALQSPVTDNSSAVMLKKITAVT